MLFKHLYILIINCSSGEFYNQDNMLFNIPFSNNCFSTFILEIGESSSYYLEVKLMNVEYITNGNLLINKILTQIDLVRIIVVSN